ncbi:MAG TPA: pyridoxal-phosphate dependent enzyme [Polyangiaceae bacterium]|nr:pyridoxal-phosphate dependent enzyme [Polyangiaceae bacterium]
MTAPAGGAGPPSGLDLATFEAARARVGAHLRRTALARLRPGEAGRLPDFLERAIVDVAALDGSRLPAALFVKLESGQVTGSFKPRGALNRLLSLPREVASRGVVTASGGNHGLAVAYAGRSLGVPTTVYLPRGAPEEKAARMRRWRAGVVRVGDVWDDAHAAALAHARREGLAYIHPFADPEVVAGQGTLALEILEQAPEIDALVVAVGGGGLIAGIAEAAKLLRPGVRVVGVEPMGAPTLSESLRAGGLVELPAITTRAGSLAPRRSDPFVFEIIRRSVDDVVLVTDDEMLEAASFLRDELGEGVELSGAAAVAAVLTGRAGLGGAAHPCALVCGAGDAAG